MSEERRLDGRHHTTQAVEILNKVHDELPGLVAKLDAAQIPVWQGKLKALVDDVPFIMEKLFLKTQGGTHLAEVSLEKVKELGSVVEQGIQGKAVADATKAVGEAVEAVEKEFGAFIHKAKTHVIRMT